MYWLDIVIIVIIISCFIYGIFRGLVREIISLGSLVLAAILATRYCNLAADHLHKLVGNERAATIIGFILIFASVLACGILIGRLVKSFLKKAGLNPMDKMLGALLGLQKAAIIIAVLLMIIGNFVPNSQEIIDESRTTLIFMPMANKLADFLPQTIWDKFLTDVKRGVNTITKYKGKLKAEGKKLEDKYQPEMEKIFPPELTEKSKEAEKTLKKELEEDRKKLRKLLKDNL